MKKKEERKGRTTFTLLKYYSKPMSLHSTERAEDGIRTRDPNLGKVVLYQLSYFRILDGLSSPLSPLLGESHSLSSRRAIRKYSPDL